MSLSGKAIETRALIARSDMLFVDTRNLRFITGLYHRNELKPAPVHELMEAGQLEFDKLNENEIVTYRLATEAFKEAIIRRKRNKSAPKADWLHSVVLFNSGLPAPDALIDNPPLTHALLMPFNSGLLQRLLSATSDALDAYQKNPRLVGTTIRFPGYLVPIKVTEALPPGGPSALEIFHYFESVETNIMINIKYGTYVFGTYIHGYFAGGRAERITSLLRKHTENMGSASKGSTQKLVNKLEREPLIARPTTRTDLEEKAVLDVILANQTPAESDLE